MNHIERTLIEQGLTHKDAMVYLATLELGSGSVLAISQRAHTPRSSTEVVLARLQQQGLVSSFRRKNIKHFTAVDPRYLLESAQQKAEHLASVVPHLSALFGTTKIKPLVRCYEGKTGVHVILREMLDEAKELLTFNSEPDWHKILATKYPDFLQTRVARKIPVKVISRDSPLSRQRQKLGPKELREVRIIHGEIEYHGMISVWNDKVAMFSLRNDLMGIVIESKELANAHRAMFQLLWHSLPPAPKY
jgi:sugar-specific transcriptional regulator TrmB